MHSIRDVGKHDSCVRCGVRGLEYDIRFVVDGRECGMMLRNAFRAGDKVPERGIYWVHHFQHRLAHPAKIMVRVFPVCRTCGDRVRFEKADVMPLVKIDVIDIDVDFDPGEPWNEGT